MLLLALLPHSEKVVVSIPSYSSPYCEDAAAAAQVEPPSGLKILLCKQMYNELCVFKQP